MSSNGKQTDYLIGTVPINFPYPNAYSSQIQVMAKVITALKNKQNAILESPTGSGKSMAILCSVLAWHKKFYSSKTKRHIKIGDNNDIPIKPSNKTDYKSPATELDKFKYNNNDNNISPQLKVQKVGVAPKIIITTRTHGQLTQLIAEYRRTAYFDNFQMVVLGSRKSLCINPMIQSLSDRNEQCRKALDNHDCNYYKNRRYMEGFKNHKKFRFGEPFDIEDLVNEGKKMSICPYFGTHTLLETAQLIFCPYNYILDPVIRDQMKIDIRNSVLVIDEAHNVESVCRDSLSKSYTISEFQLCKEEFDRLLKLTGRCKLPTNIFESISEIKELVNCIITWMDDLNNTFSDNDYACHRNVFPNPRTNENKLSNILNEHFNYTKSNKDQFGLHAKEIFKYFEEIRKEINDPTIPLPDTNSNTNRSPSKWDRRLLRLNPKAGVVIEYLCFYILPNVLDNENDFHMALLPQDVWDSKERQKVRKLYLHFWCLSPAVAFKTIGAECHSVVLTSGTLSPIDAIAYELKTKFDTRLVADHVIDKRQVLVTAIPRGINGTLLKVTYSNLKEPKFQDDIGLSLLYLMENIPKGIVVFFTAYHTMQTLIDRWIQNGIYSKMQNVKNIYTEPRGSDEEATQQFMDAIHKFGRNCGNIKYIQKFKRTNEYKRLLRKAKKEKKEKEKQKKGTMFQYLPQIKKDYSFKPTSGTGSGVSDDDIDIKDLDLDPSHDRDKGAAFFGVCRGKISEGIDFSDGMSRAVILIGIPYPNQKEVTIFFKKAYNEREAQKLKAQFSTSNSNNRLNNMNKMRNEPYILSGKEWYSQQAFRALNQALGRCIRHRYDYGCVIFLDARFVGTGDWVNSKQNQLSKWIRPCIRECINVKQCVNEYIKPFFEYMKKTPPSIKLGKKWTGPFNMPINKWIRANNMNNNNCNQKNRFFTQQRSGSGYGNNRSFNDNKKNRSFTSTTSTQMISNNNNNNNRGFSFNSPKNNQFNKPRNINNNNRSFSSAISQISPAQSISTPGTGSGGSTSTPQTPYDNNNNNNNDNSNNSNNKRKRKFTEIQNENDGDDNYTNKNNKRLKGNNYHTNNHLNSNQNINNKKNKTSPNHINNNNPHSNNTLVRGNCIKCNCGVMVCHGELNQYKSVSFGKYGEFYEVEEEFPCTINNDCLWNSILGLCFMKRNCHSCKNTIGFHVVAASSSDKLKYIKKVLYLNSNVELLTVR